MTEDDGATAHGHPAELAPESGSLRFVVVGLVLVAVLSIVAVTLLSYARRPSPDALVGIGSASVGALATLLARVGLVNGQRP